MKIPKITDLKSKIVKIKAEVMKKIKSVKKSKIIIAIIVATVLLISLVSSAHFLFNKTNDTKEVITGKPYYNDVVLTVSGSGTIVPYERYEIVPMVSGDIIECVYEEGDEVLEGDVLYVFDHTEQDKNVESAKNAITKSLIRNKKYLNSEEYNKTLSKYSVRAESDGIISGFNLKKGDRVSENNTYGTIQDIESFKAIVPFNAAQCEKINQGDKATVNLFPSMYSLEGVVTYKSFAPLGYSSGAVMYEVEIALTGKALSLTDTSVGAVIHTSMGDVEAPASGKIEKLVPKDIKPLVSGEISYIPDNIKNGSKVKEGDILFYIDNSDFIEEKKLADFDYNDLQLALENAYDRLENYEITSPINGTVITKNSKKGDTISGGGSSSSVLMVIADMSKMKFTFQADETDINKIEVGQEVEVSADAVENKVFSGKVTNIATEGISSNGVSYYEVEVVVEDYGQNDENGYLRSGMNVSAKIIYEKELNALCVPVSAVTELRGESFVFVKGNDSDRQKREDLSNKENIPENNSKKFAEEKTKTGEEDAVEERIYSMAPEGFYPVRVKTGATDGVNIVILGGLTEDDVIYLAEGNNVLPAVMNPSAGGFSAMGGSMSGGMMSGGMMSGGSMRQGQMMNPMSGGMGR